MYRTIIVPLDGSEYSERALVTATSLARVMGAQLVLVRAVSTSVFPGVDATEAQVKAVGEAEAYLTALSRQLAEKDMRVEIAVPFMSAPEGILLEINQRKADMVVMCTHGRSGLGRWIYGSVAEKVLAHSPVPVLLVKPTGLVTPLLLGSAQAPLLVPLDGSSYAEAALPYALDLSRTFGRKLILLRVATYAIVPVNMPGQNFTFPSEVQEMVNKEEQQEAEDYLAKLTERLKADGQLVQSMVRWGEPAETIQEESKATGAGMIIMTTHGQTGLKNVIMGDVALEVVRLTSLPLFLVRPAELKN
jgi:nucleotide-binding universal stress UspA family protein